MQFLNKIKNQNLKQSIQQRQIGINSIHPQNSMCQNNADNLFLTN